MNIHFPVEEERRGRERLDYGREIGRLSLKLTITPSSLSPFFQMNDFRLLSFIQLF
jgi:hypothetical protein